MGWPFYTDVMGQKFDFDVVLSITIFLATYKFEENFK